MMGKLVEVGEMRTLMTMMKSALMLVTRRGRNDGLTRLGNVGKQKLELKAIE